MSYRPPAAYARSRRRSWQRLWKFRALYLMLLPGLVWYAIFRYMPMYGVLIAFKDFNPLDGILGSPWADPWYKHFRTFFTSPYFGQLMANTLLISLYKLLFGMVPPLLLAILLNECRASWFRRIIQTLSYMPHFLSWVIIYGILLALFSQSSGLINRWIVEGGGRALPFLTSPAYFRSLLVGSDIWQNLGWGAIIYLAAISRHRPDALRGRAGRWGRTAAPDLAYHAAGAAQRGHPAADLAHRPRARRRLRADLYPL